jgi:PKD repeat protein
MNTKMFTRLLFGLLVLVAACSKKESEIASQTIPRPGSAIPPRAQFSITPTDMREPVRVQFNNTSVNADSYIWEFGDGTFSTEKNPTKTFQRSGLYSVKLTAIGSGGSNTITIPVGVNPRPTKFIIKKVSIIDANLSGYDGPLDGGDPDVYVHVPGQQKIMATDVVNNARSIASLVWNVNWAFDLNQSNSFEMIVGDVDNNGDDVMGGITIQISDYMTLDNHYPTQITKTQEGITIKLDVEWN